MDLKNKKKEEEGESLKPGIPVFRASLVAQLVKNLSALQETMI